MTEKQDDHGSATDRSRCPVCAPGLSALLDIVETMLPKLAQDISADLHLLEEFEEDPALVYSTCAEDADASEALDQRWKALAYDLGELIGSAEYVLSLVRAFADSLVEAPIAAEPEKGEPFDWKQVPPGRPSSIRRAFRELRDSR